jgi:hypothetical protein
MRIGALMVAAPLVAGVLLPGATAEAAAAPGAKIYVENGYTATKSFTIRAKTAAGGGSLLIDGAPHGYGKNATLSYVFDGHSQSNGKHTIKVQGTNTLLWWDSATVTFTSAVPALPPSGVSATVSGSKVTVTWNQGQEPDITGYKLSSSVKSFTVGNGACGGTQCSKTFDAGKSSGTLAISVSALRRGAGASPARQTSAKLTGSGTQTSPNGNVPAPPAPGPGDNTNQAPIPIPSGFGTPAPDSPQVFPQVTTKPFVYPTPQQETAGDTNLLTAGSQDAVTTDGTLQWGKSVAIALILLLAAAHLGTWTRRLRAANGTTGRGGLFVTPGSAHARVQSSREQIEAALLAARTKSEAEAATKTKPTKERKRRSRKKPGTKPATSARAKADLVHPARPVPAEEPASLAQRPEPFLDLLASPEPQPVTNSMSAPKANSPEDFLPETSSTRTEILELPKPRRSRSRRARK